MGIFVPQGSYTLTTTDITSTLQCQAQKRDGSYVSATLDLTKLDAADVSNEDGVLVNTGRTATPNGYVPGGSYTLTCTGVKVILSGSARKIDGTSQTSTLDITDVPVASTVSNLNGVLTVDQ